MSDQEPKIEEEPVISENVKKQKISTLKFKINPELDYFPGN